ncbi:MAG: transposase, partial [Deltaproteobacteria bacterium]|nr:transposase [Deltaproteobacteria bacterium]
VDARWAKKNQEKHYGYKNHVNVDEANKLVQNYAVSDAAVHDSQVFESQIHEKGSRRHPLTDEQKASNRIKSKTRARVEHVFGAQHAMGGHIVRTIGLARAKAKIGMINLVYNMKRLVQLIRRDALAANLRCGYIRRGVSAVA